MPIKHIYDEIAKELADLLPSTKLHNEFTDGQRSGVHGAIRTLANIFKRDNPNFDTEKFLLAATRRRP